MGRDGRERVSVGVAAHSVRAVPAEWLAAIAGYSDEHGLVRHVHASEQRRELAEIEAEHGCSPIELLHRTGFLGPRTSVVHAIWVTTPTSPGSPRRSRSSSPARRPRATSATATCRA